MLSSLYGQPASSARHIQLQGGVLIEHPLGHLHAGELVWQANGHGDLATSYLQLSSAVELSLANGATLYCLEGEIDMEQKRGQLRGSPNCLISMQKGPTRWLLAAPQLQLLLSEPPTQLPECIIAGSGVVLSSPAFTLLAHEAHYFPQRQQLVFWGSAQQPCLFMHLTLSQKAQSSDDILLGTCQRVTVNLSEMSVEGEGPRLVILQPERALSAEAQRMHWQHAEHKLLFTDQVELFYASSAVLRGQQLSLHCPTGSEEALLYHVGEQAHLLFWPHLHSHPPQPWHITTPSGFTGSFTKESLILSRIAPVVSEQQLHVLLPPYGQLLADSFQIFFSSAAAAAVRSLHIDGEVKMLAASVVEKGLKAVQAGHVEYDFERQTGRMQASNGQKVLVYDQENGIIAAAKAFYSQPKENSAEPPALFEQKIIGEGDVHFRFVKKNDSAFRAIQQAFERK